MADYKNKLWNIDSINPKETNIVFIRGEFNDEYTKEMEEKNEKSLNEKGFNNIEKFKVPGALEIPAFIKRVIEKKEKVDLIIVFGVVIRGETTHYDIVSQESARAIMDLSIKYTDKVAIINGLLTCENHQQVRKRVETSEGYSTSGLNLLVEIKKLKSNK